MLYPVYIHPGDDRHAHGVTIPDLPGCFSAADVWDELPTKIQEAVEVYFQGEAMELPVPTPLDQLTQDPEYQGGIWMLADIDISTLDTKPVRLNISLPGGLVKRIDSYAKRHHMSRSGFVAKAALTAIQHERVDERAT
jgi:predicted RNase H-like HicB family nuclease